MTVEMNRNKDAYITIKIKTQETVKCLCVVTMETAQLTFI